MQGNIRPHYIFASFTLLFHGRISKWAISNGFEYIVGLIQDGLNCLQVKKGKNDTG